MAGDSSYIQNPGWFEFVTRNLIGVLQGYAGEKGDKGESDILAYDEKHGAKVSESNRCALRCCGKQTIRNIMLHY